MSSAAGSIAALAAQIQDRHLRYSSEQTVLGLLQDEQTEQQHLLDEAKNECGYVRMEFLSASQARNGTELELWQIETKKRECMEAMDQLQEETRGLVEHKEEIQSGWEELANDLLADHQLKREIYRHSVEASIGRREALVKQRNSQLEALEAKIESLRGNQHSMEEEKKQLNEDLEGFKHTEQEEDEELSKLALEVKEMIAKRSNLRKSLREHKKAFEEANEETLKWEKECVELAGAGGL